MRIAVRVSGATLGQIDAHAAHRGLSRSAMADRLIELGLVHSAKTWLTLTCERVHYVSPARDLILCDRLASPVTLVLKLAENEPLEPSE